MYYVVDFLNSFRFAYDGNVVIFPNVARNADYMLFMPTSSATIETVY